MRINILITGGLYDSAAGHSAWHFCQAALDAGHEITQIFCYQAGVSLGTTLSEVLADEFDTPTALVDLAAENSIPLVVCVSAGERRGIISAAQQAELNKPACNLNPVFSVEGLASFHAACLDADRTVTFK